LANEYYPLDSAKTLFSSILKRSTNIIFAQEFFKQGGLKSLRIWLHQSTSTLQNASNDASGDTNLSLSKDILTMWYRMAILAPTEYKIAANNYDDWNFIWTALARQNDESIRDHAFAFLERCKE
jgi:hypothetical protein